MVDIEQIVRYPSIIRYGRSTSDFELFLNDLLAAVRTHRATVVAGPHTIEVFGREVASHLKSFGVGVRQAIAGSSDEQSVAKISAAAGDSELVISVGGGKVIDVGKMAAHRLGVPFVSIPTVLSNDGIASPVAVIDGVSRFTTPPIAVYLPLDIIRMAPIRHIRAGIGDLVSNISATTDWELAHAEIGEPIVDIAVLLARGGAFSILGEPVDVTDIEYLKRIAIGLIQSGLAMELAGSSRPASGAEHKISHAIDALYRDKVTTLHGEQTALGTIVAQFLRDADVSYLLDFFKKVDLPTDWNGIGLDDSEMADVLVHAATKIRPERFTVLEKFGMTRPKALKVVGELKSLLMSQ